MSLSCVHVSDVSFRYKHIFKQCMIRWCHVHWDTWFAANDIFLVQVVRICSVIKACFEEEEKRMNILPICVNLQVWQQRVSKRPISRNLLAKGGDELLYFTCLACSAPIMYVLKHFKYNIVECTHVFVLFSTSKESFRRTNLYKNKNKWKRKKERKKPAKTKTRTNKKQKMDLKKGKHLFRLHV